MARSKSEERAEVKVEGFRARSTCLGLQVVQRAGFRWRYEKLGHMESLPIILIAHSSYIGPAGDWDLKTRKRTSDFGCLKDKWARFGYKSRSNFLVLYLGLNPRCPNY
jgi:hypothetical protein